MAYLNNEASLSSVVGARLNAGPANDRFDPKALQPKPGLASLIAAWLVDHPRWLFAIFRRVAPIPVFKGWALITRYDDVREVLARQDAFPVPFGPKIEILNGGAPNFLLGMQDGADYRALQKQVSSAFPASDYPSRVVPLAAEIASDLVLRSRGRIDAVQDLITLVPTRLCERYYGVPVADETRLGQLTIAMSTFMFGDPADNPTIRDQALKAGDELRPMIDRAIAAAHQGQTGGDTIVGRLVARPADGSTPLSDAVVRSILIGMMTGFVPTNTMAAGHMLDVLLGRPDMMAACQSAAQANDADRLWRCLWEAFRFRPLNPGPFRVCGADAVIAAGTPRAKIIKQGTKLLVSTQSGMFDPRRIENPETFDPTRPPHDYMMFGSGLHFCIGAPLARAQITQTLKPLLLRRNLRRAPGSAGRLQKEGPFPAHLWVEFDAE